MSESESNLSHLPQTSIETLEAYKALGEKVETLAGAYEQALVLLRDARRLLDEALAKAEEWRKMHSEALGETAKARDDLSIALRALEASRVSEAAWKGMYEASRVSLDEAHATLEKLPKTRIAPDTGGVTPGPCRLCSKYIGGLVFDGEDSRYCALLMGHTGPCSDVQPPPCVREAPQEPEFLPGDLARASTDTSPSSDFWPPIGRVDGSIVWLHYARGDVQCKKAMLVRKPVISGDYMRVWRGPAQGLRGRVDSYDPNNGALRINGTDWVNLTDVVAVKP